MGNYCKYYKQKFEITYDGITWIDTGLRRRGELYDAYSSDCPSDYLTLVALEDGTFSFSGNSYKNMLSYSIDNGSTWNGPYSSVTVNVQQGDRVMWKGDAITYANGSLGHFSSTMDYDVENNIMSLVYGDNFDDNSVLVPGIHNFIFSRLFWEWPLKTTPCYGLRNAEKLNLPSSYVTTGCYADMFQGCSLLQTAPELPAISHDAGAYAGMFYECSSLKKAPSKIYFQDGIKERDFEKMFEGCRSLMYAPDLTNISGDTTPYTFYRMFDNCQSLIEVSDINVGKLSNYCFDSMFEGCWSLEKTPNITYKQPIESEVYYMQWAFNRMFSDCYSLKESTIEFPIYVGNYMCYEMFRECWSLEKIPILSATTIPQYGYTQMFLNCHSLSEITCLATSIAPAGLPTNSWVSGVASKGTFHKDASMSSWGVGPSAIPEGWLVENYGLTYRYVDVDYTCKQGNKWLRQQQQVSYDSGSTWTDVGWPSATTLVEANSYDCGYRTRTTSGTPYCGGPSQFNKFIDITEQVSIDSGNTWRTVDSDRIMISKNSEDCGYDTPYKWYANVGAETKYCDCNSSKAISSNASSVDFGNCVTGISNNLFKGNSSLYRVTLSDSITSIGNSAFSGCTSLTSITIPDSVTTIGYAAFKGCRSLKKCIIGNNVETIGGGTFQDCNRLTNIVIPDSVRSIGATAFDSCSSLTSCTIGSGVNGIGDAAFRFCGNLTNIDIPDSVTSIGDLAFYECSGLTSVTIGSGITFIGEQAFYKTNNLKSILIKAATPPVLKDDDCGDCANYCFVGNSCPIYVNELSVEAYKTAWPKYAYRIQPFRYSSGTPYCIDCSKYIDVYANVSYDSGHTWVVIATKPTLIDKISSDCGCLEQWVAVSGGYECSGTTKMSQEKKQVSYDEGSTWTDVVPLETRAALPVIEYDSTDCGYIPPVGEFKYRLTLQDSTIVTGVCDSTSAITQSEISPYTSTTVAAEIGDCITSIGSGAFYGCSSLTSCTIGSGVTSISNNAFTYCTSLTSIDIPDSVTTIGNWTFGGCTGLTSIDISSGATSIGEYAFVYCGSLTSVTIPNSVTSIGNNAFQGCNGLTSIDISSGATSIGDYAFLNCSSLTSIIVNATTPPTLGNQAFNNTNDCTIYVPASSVNAYKTAWSDYASRIQAIP